MTNSSIPVTAIAEPISEDEQTRVALFKDQVAAMFIRGDYAMALTIVEEGMAQFTERQERSGQAMALYQFGQIYRTQRNLSASLNALQQSLDIYESLRDSEGMVNAINGMGITFKHGNDYPAALRNFQRCIPLAKSINDRGSEANALCNMASIYTQIGDNATALETFYSSLPLYEEMGNEHMMAIALHNIGINYTVLKDPKAAIPVLERGLAILEKKGDRYHIASLVDVLGAAHIDLNQVETGLEYLYRGLRIFEDLGMPALVAMCLARIAGTLIKQGRFEEGEALLERSLAVNGKAGDRLHYCETLGRLGDLYAVPTFSRHSDEKAIQLLQEARLIGEELDSFTLLCSMYSLLADLYERQGNLKEALAFHRLMYQAEKRLFNEQSDERVKNLQVRFDVAQAQQAAEIARRDAEIAHLRTVELAEALQEAERLRALADAQARLDGLTGIPNRRYLDEMLTEEWKRSIWSGSLLTVVLIDIDHFKRINDNFGHGIGDVALRYMASILQNSCRSNDMVARYGGEEFAMILPATDAATGRVLCEKIRAQVEAEDWSQIAPGLQVTISIGLCDVATLLLHRDRKTASSSALLTIADQNLYAAKTNGRNQVVG